MKDITEKEFPKKDMLTLDKKLKDAAKKIWAKHPNNPKNKSWWPS